MRLETLNKREPEEVGASVVDADVAGAAPLTWATSRPSNNGNHCCRTSTNSGQYFLATGSVGGKPSFSKFLYCPRCKIRKSRCGPVESPVLPTSPIVFPISTRSPWRTNMRDKCRYIVSYPSECAI